MGWLRLVGSIKLQVSFAKETYKRDYILQKRHNFMDPTDRSHPVTAAPMRNLSYLCVRCSQEKAFCTLNYTAPPLYMCDINSSAPVESTLFMYKKEMRRFHMCGITHSFIEMRLIHMCDMTHSWGGDVTHSYVRHDSLMCAP